MAQVVQDKKQLIPPVVAHVTTFTVDHAEGSWVWDTEGNKWLDFTCGIAVTNTGHCHPKVVAAAREQAGKIIHAMMNIYYHQPMLDLMEKLSEIVPGDMDRFMFANSGAEAVEGGVKLAKQATRRPVIVAFQNAFHGRTHMAMSLTCSKTIYRGHYEPLPNGVYHAPFAYPFRAPRGEDVTDWALDGLDRVLSAQVYPDDVAGIVIEPIQGEGGFIVPPPEFLQGVRKKADEIGALLVVDEIQTGMGRTGKWFNIEYAGVRPDVVIIAKGIASGFPLSCIASRAEFFDRLTPGSHGGTYGGNAVASAAAIATIDAIREEGMVENAARQGEKLRAFWTDLQAMYPAIGDVRGMGLMDAIEIVKPGTREPDAAAAKKFLGECAARKVIVLGCGVYDNCARFLPPINLSDADLDHALGVFEEAAKVAFKA